ncbi:MAG: zinc finger CCCH domain-containing protein [Chlamydiota bacterium]
MSSIQEYRPKCCALLEKFAGTIDVPTKTIDTQKEEAVSHPNQFGNEIKRIQNLIRDWLQRQGSFPKNYKFKLCEKILQNSVCTYGNKCQYAHSLVVNYAFRLLQYPPFKRRGCDNWIECNYGKFGLCGYAHKGDLMQGSKGWEKGGWKIYRGEERETSPSTPASLSPISFLEKEPEVETYEIVYKVYDFLRLDLE